MFFCTFRNEKDLQDALKYIDAVIQAIENLGAIT